MINMIDFINQKGKYISDLPTSSCVFIEGFYSDKLAQFYYKDSVRCTCDSCLGFDSVKCKYHRFYANRDSGIYFTVKSCETRKLYADNNKKIEIAISKGDDVCKAQKEDLALSFITKNL